LSRENIDPQLLADCHCLGELSQSTLLLHRNAAVAWFIVVPDTPIADFLDLPDHHRQAVLEECAGVSSYVKLVRGYEKVNFAGLGNVVRQMHLHVIGRHVGDACWPQPVWGNLPEGRGYSEAEILDIQEELVKAVGLAPSPDPF